MPDSPAPETDVAETQPETDPTPPIEVPKAKDNVRQLTPPEYFAKEDRKDIRNLRLTVAVVALSVIGTGYFGYKHIFTPEYQARVAADNAQKQADLLRSAQIARETFETAKALGSGLYVIDLSRLDEAAELLKKHPSNSSGDHPSTRTLINENFHFFKEAHPGLVVIGIVDPNDIRPTGYGQFVDKPNQMIVITRAKGK